MASDKLLTGVDFDEDQIWVTSLGEEEELPLSVPTPPETAPDAAGIPPQGFSKDQLKHRLATVLEDMKSSKKESRLKALRDFTDLLKKTKDYPTLELPTSMLGQLVAVSSFCALDPDPQCHQQAAESLCHLLPILRRKEGMLKQSMWGCTLIIRAQCVLNPTSGPVPAIFINNCYALARVFGASFPPEQLLETISCLAGDLSAQRPSAALDISHLLQEFLKQFSNKALKVEVLLDALLRHTKGPTKEARQVATSAFSFFSYRWLGKVFRKLLKFPFCEYKEVWQEVFTAADHQKLLHLLAEEMHISPLAESAATVQCLTNLLHTVIQQADYKADVCNKFPELAIALLGMIQNFQQDQEFLVGAEETLRLLLETVEDQLETGFVQQLFSPDTFMKGLSAMVRALGTGPGTWIPPMVAYIRAALNNEEFPGVPEIAAAIYIELLSLHMLVHPCEETLEDLLTWLNTQDNQQVQKLCITGICHLLNSSMDPQILQLTLLEFLPCARAEVIPELMHLMEQAIVSQELEKAFITMLAETYCDLVGHEEAVVRATAIQHLGQLRGRAGDQWLPGTAEEAIGEVFNVLIHLEDEYEVVEAAMEALCQMVPAVKWWPDPSNFSLHCTLHQAAKYLHKTYSKDKIRRAALKCLMPSTDELAAASRVAALLLGLEGMQQHKDEAVRCAGRSTMNLIKQAFADLPKGRMQRLIRRLVKCLRRRNYPPDFLLCMTDHPQ